MASFVEGAEALNAKLGSFAQAFEAHMDARLDDEVKGLQQMTADLMPVDTGQARDAVLSPKAIRHKPRQGKNGKASWTFGLALDYLQGRLTYYLFFVEFGTKGYEVGEERVAGVYKRAGTGEWHWVSTRTRRNEARFEYREEMREDGTMGLRARLIDRRRYQRMKRSVPARPATPFFRPAVSEFMVRLRQTRAIAKVYAAAVTAAGLNGSSRD